MNKASRFWVALLPAMVVPFLASLFYFVVFREHIFARLLYGAAKIFTVVWPLLCVYAIFRSKFGEFDIRSPRHRKAIPGGIAVGLLMVALVYGAMKTPLGSIVRDGAENLRGKALQFGILEYYWSFSLFLSVVCSLIEEYYWRWFVYGTLRRRMGIIAALILAGTSFAAHHVVILSQFFPLLWALILGVMVGVGGVVWCLMYERQRTLVGIWLSHIIVDFGVMSIGYVILFR